ncbi:MAG: SPFH domain-containing protein [Pseudomonadota bacterium]|nr:SPFH domain-containing protein [Pseudomonadota bacterium]
MGLWDFFSGQFIDVISWTGNDDDLMVYRFERAGNEIKYGAMLTVRESQSAVFINEGTIADTFPPGLYRLETANLPILTNLQAWPYGFESPFKAEVYFVSTRQFTDLKWGTKKPLMMRDTEFGPVRLRAFGTYTIRINDAPKFLREVAGTDGYFTTGEITDQLRNIITSRFADILGGSEIPILDLAANYDDLGEFLTNKINPEFEAYGLELTKLLVENISLPSEVEKALDKRTSMGMLGNLRNYTEFQMAESMTKAAENPSGGGATGIGMGLGMGAGMAMGNKLGQTLSESSPPVTVEHPPPLPDEHRIYYLAIDGKQGGPYRIEELTEQAAHGLMDRSTLVWRHGMKKWRRAAELKELSEVLKHRPPALPR